MIAGYMNGIYTNINEWKKYCTPEEMKTIGDKKLTYYLFNFLVELQFGQVSQDEFEQFVNMLKKMIK